MSTSQFGPVARSLHFEPCACSGVSSACKDIWGWAKCHYIGGATVFFTKIIFFVKAPGHSRPCAAKQIQL